MTPPEPHTIWRHDMGTAQWYVFVEGAPHAGWDGTPTVYVRTRAVIDGVRCRTHKAIMTVDALLSRYVLVDPGEWPGVLTVGCVVHDRPDGRVD